MDLMVVLAVAVVAVLKAVVGWEGCLWRSMLIVAKNMVMGAVGFAAVVQTDR
jgi:hypothetical protein